MRRLAITLLILSAGACGKKSDSTSTPTTPSTPSATPLLVSGSDMGPLFEHVSITRGGTAVAGAAPR